MKRVMLPAAIIMFICTSSFAAPLKHSTSGSSILLSSKFSSALALVPAEVKVGNYKIIDETATDEDQGSITRYDVMMKGKHFEGDVSYSTDGQMISYSEKMKDIKLPAPVIEAIKAKYPDARFTKDREIINSKKGMTDKYKVHFKNGKKHGYALVDANGKIIKSRERRFL